jgi:RNA polymerase-binding transcription factor DksA
MATAKKTAASKAPAAKKSPTKAAAAPAKGVAKKAPAAKAAATPASASPEPAPATAPVKKAPVKKAPAAESSGTDIPAPKGTSKDGIAYTKDFDAKFLKAQYDLLLSERAALLGQANRLEDEANSLIEDNEMGDVQFDEESGEGDTMVVERERDLALSAQARQTIAEIDAALARFSLGTYGYSVASGRPIPRERLEAIPWATELVEEKVGGIGRR